MVHGLRVSTYEQTGDFVSPHWYVEAFKLCMCMHIAWMWPIATRVARSVVSVSDSLCVQHAAEPCKTAEPIEPANRGSVPTGQHSNFNSKLVAVLVIGLVY